MKSLFLSVVFTLSLGTSFSQTLTWSTDVVKPKRFNMYSGFEFPGADDINYYVNEYEGGGVTLKVRKEKDYLTVVDKNTLKVKTRIDLNEAFKENDLDLSNATNFFLKDRKYYFFVNRDNKEKNVYDIYCSIQKMDGVTSSELNVIQKVDRRQNKPFHDNYDPKADNETKEDAAKKASSYIRIKPANDGRSIISALITETLDENYSTLNVTEWDKDMKAMHSNNYKVTFRRRQVDKRTNMNNLGNLGELPAIIDFAKDNYGFVYVLVYTADPASPDTRSQYTVYQFKPSDPAYMKGFKKELNRNIASANVHLFQDESGKLFFCNIGVDIQSEKDEKKQLKVNTAIIGSFNEHGDFVTIYANTLPVEMMYKFEKEKAVNRNDGKLNGLEIENVLPAKDGGCYVIWHYHQDDGTGNIHVRDNNALVQHFDANNKLKWEKVIYKEAQVGAGMLCFIQDDALRIVWPDNPSNEKRGTDDDDPATYKGVKAYESNGIFVAKFNIQGEYTRQFLHLPPDRNRYNIETTSLWRVGKNEFIGTALSFHQGAVDPLSSAEYSFFKLVF